MSNKTITTIRRVLNYKMFFVVSVSILILLGLSFGREFVRSSAIKKEIAELESERSQLEEKNLSLSAYKDYLETEAFLEHEARDKFGLQRPGESQVYIAEGTSIDVNDLNAQTAGFVEGYVFSAAKLWSLYFFDPDKFAEYKTR